MTTTELALVRSKEIRQARKTRGCCGVCGHKWTPRNGNQTISRCPSCGARGAVTYIVLNDEPSTAK